MSKKEKGMTKMASKLTRNGLLMPKAEAIHLPQAFSFVPILPKHLTRSQDPNLVVGKAHCYISGAFFRKYGAVFKQVRVLWDEAQKVVGLHFHSSSNHIPDSFSLHTITKSDSRSFSSKTLRDRIHETCDEATFVGPIEEAFQEGPDFFIVQLKPEKQKGSR